MKRKMRLNFLNLMKGTALSVLASVAICGGSAQASPSGITANSSAPQLPDVPALESEYRLRSLHRNQIAAQLKWLWREERFLKEDYEYSGEKGDVVTNTEVARQLLQTRERIDALRAELSRENKVIQSIGDRIPD